MSNNETLVVVSDITANKRFQMRTAGLNREAVESYAEALANGAEFPPVVIFDTGAHRLLVDGFHRLAATELANIANINAMVLKGTEEQALTYARRYSNRTNGQRLTREDIRQICYAIISDPENHQKPNSVIAEMANVTSHTIAKYRVELNLVPETITTATGVERKAGAVSREEVEYQTGGPATGVQLPAMGGYGVFAERVSDRAIQKTGELLSAIKKLNDAELAEYVIEPQREELKAALQEALEAVQ